MAIDRIQVLVQGLPTGPGVLTLYSVPGGGHQADVADFCSVISNHMPDSTNLHVPAEGDTFDEASGVLTGTWASGVAGDFGGSGGADYAAGVGAHVNWQTATIVNGRRVRGRTFIVPLAALQYAADGTLTEVARIALTGAATTYQAAVGADGIIWHRPVAGVGGVAAPITGSNLPDKVAFLSSRR